MTDTPPATHTSFTMASAMDAIRFERSTGRLAFIGLLAFCGIKIASLFGYHVPGGTTAAIFFLGFLFITTAFQFCRHLIAMAVFGNYVASLERQAILIQASMQPNEPDQPPPDKTTRTDTGEVIDLMSRLRGDDHPKSE